MNSSNFKVKITPFGFAVVEPDSHLGIWCQQAGRLDVAREEIMALYAQYIPKGGVVIDAGASLGDHACTYAQIVGDGGVVFAFEPHPVTYQALKHNMEVFPWVRTLNIALGAEKGSVGFSCGENIGGSHVTDDRSETVPCATLDALFLELMFALPRVDFIHLDVEGKECAVLRGAVSMIEKFKPVMVLEVNVGAMARFGENEALLREVLDLMGYEVRELATGNGPHMEQRDILCLPRK